MSWDVTHNHVTREIRPPGHCVGCDVYHDAVMEVPVCYERHVLAPGIHQHIPHFHKEETK